jgi:tRNA(Ile)-lysidine synthase
MTNPTPWELLKQEVNRQWHRDRWRDVRVVVGCSGGADSVALLRCLAELRNAPVTGTADSRGSLIAAHFNHGLRGQESDGDQRFVQTLATQLGLGCEIGIGDGNKNDESSLREARLQFLVQVAKRTGARYIALAHSADDNVETILHHLFRGTGPAGLAGIGSPRPIDDDLVIMRPLLQTGRQTIRDAMRAENHPWREDSSNAELDYRRNWIRNELLPLVESKYSGASRAMVRAIEGQREWRQIIDRLARDWTHAHRVTSAPLTLRKSPDTDPAILVSAMQALWVEQQWPRRDMSRNQWLRLSESLRSTQSDRFTLPGDIDVEADTQQVRIGPKSH